MKNLILLPWAMIVVLLLFQCPKSTNGQGVGGQFGFLLEANEKIQQILKMGQNKDIPSLIQVILDVSAGALKFPLLQCPSEAGGNFEVCIAPVRNKIEAMNSDNSSDKTNQQVVETKMDNCGLLRGVIYCAKSVVDTCAEKIILPAIPTTVQKMIEPKLDQLECDMTVFENRPYGPSSPTTTTTTTTTTSPVPTTTTETSRTTPAPLVGMANSHSLRFYSLPVQSSLPSL